MEVILQEKIHNLGSLGDQVKVKPGYGRNYLIPQGKAVPATPDNVAKFEARRAELEKAQAEQLAAAQARAGKINGLKLTLPRKAAEEGKLYGSVATADIVEAAEAAGAELEKHELHMPEPIRAIGEYELHVSLHADVECTITVVVVAEDAA
ncbi:large subunit ribosomal protein L9 [Methylohalomonas lacus]|uniref:Large ribosomal subunit protein bL9 n=1 Tax=Methylohalomonas lacus TaxID=398773 RepID=A0AAE3HJK3_9GAMM|nr:50S ribosomal protein L9 [Methylohalomonas lacus]MCS3902403.1 large subunit ribosomal protein L9 [Methylohalomonas lacus]